MYKEALAFPPLEYANVRSGPGIEHQIVNTIKKATRVKVLNEKNGWHEVLYFDRNDRPHRGWIFPGVGLRELPLVQEVLTTEEVYKAAENPQPPLLYPVEPYKPLNGSGWPGEWYDATGFARYYEATGVGAYHTGADLNLKGNADRGASVFSVGNGEVLFARTFKVWGKIIVVKHDINSKGIYIHARYAHVDELYVKPGDRVMRGQLIATVGDGERRYSHHLHFDLSPTDVLAVKPTHWPGMDKANLYVNYVDPAVYIEETNLGY